MVVVFFILASSFSSLCSSSPHHPRAPCTFECPGLHLSLYLGKRRWPVPQPVLPAPGCTLESAGPVPQPVPPQMTTVSVKRQAEAQAEVQAEAQAEVQAEAQAGTFQGTG